MPGYPKIGAPKFPTVVTMNFIVNIFRRIIKLLNNWLKNIQKKSCKSKISFQFIHFD